MSPLSDIKVLCLLIGAHHQTYFLMKNLTTYVLACTFLLSTGIPAFSQNEAQPLVEKRITQPPAPKRTDRNVSNVIWEPAPKGMKTQPEIKQTPEQELDTWLENCERKIRRQWRNKNAAQNTACSLKLRENGQNSIIKAMKSQKKADSIAAISVIEKAIETFDPAPDKLVYDKTFVIEFLDHPVVKVTIK